MVGAAALLLASPLLAPQLLAFPHRAETSIGTVWSERPLDPEFLESVAAQTEGLVEASPLASGNERRPIFITDGGWRWIWLAASARGGFALSRPLTRAVVVNETDASGVVRNGALIGGERELARVLAHEFTHGMIRRRFGLVPAVLLPKWKVEGYCDHVARESSLDPDDVVRLQASGSGHPALLYYHGRRRVAATLARNGGSVDDLFALEW